MSEHQNRSNNPVEMMADSVGISDDMQSLQGVWVQISCEANGIPNPIEEYGDHPVTIIEGQTFTVRHADGKTMINGTFTLNPETEPKSIDWHDTSGTDAGKTFPAIYQLDEDTFMFCAGEEGCRPTGFKTREGQVLRIFQRTSK